MLSVERATRVALALSLAACSSPSSGGGLPPAGTGGASAEDAAAGAAGAQPDASGGSGADDGGLLLDSAINPDAQVTADTACAAEAVTAEPVPLNLYLMLDRSGSMGSATSGNWYAVKTGLTSFFADSASAGLRVALNYFPTGDDSCDPADYSTPAVGLAPLTADPAPADAHETALLASLAAQDPTGLTPMYGALAGALGFAVHQAVTKPGEKVAVVLVTDGSPNSCPETPVDQNQIGVIAALAGSAYTGDPPVVTFSVGLQGSNEAELQAIAAAGGGKAFFLGSSPSVPQDLILALQEIAGSQLACELALPTPESGTLDPNEVNVEFTAGNGAKVPLYKVADAASCVPNGWYYDDPVAPARVLLCPGACAGVQADPQGRIDVLFGCESIPPP
jgi:Mg-chelatase subunit ChlD